MEIALRDKLLLCQECGSQFAYTVGQQRMAHREESAPADPQFCPVCEIKIERMGRRISPPTAASFPDEAHQGNGHHTAPKGDANGAPAAFNGAQPEPNEVATATEKPASAYRTGSAHPLAGHSGETRSGSVKWFNDRKGFGFLTLDDGNELFVHFSGIGGEGYKTLKDGQRVQLTIEDTDKGPQATNVLVIGEAPADS